ncbi:two-component sensor histidine kinase [Mycolicibacterium cyprinidarum]|uniref:histidine kinase n=1 Tax=Mycolicibacterium cyprinidarum TaxID=2860311 RepID=A0ABQ4V6J4_9MYCO|nr:two-component sensor histidine kinase [Mycolicibacterium sp. NGTWSNA01]GJF12697.1 two-component sensor histidine kinase [Mycolicibacterium sp. NGTWS1803]GJF14805.1 two-component sensor histidine kinase [Mycolicibacterium sp. NGTWS0302]
MAPGAAKRTTMSRVTGQLARWTVRTRSTVAAALVVTLGVAVASAAMLLVLYQTLQRSSQAAAQTRASQLVEQLRSDEPTELDPGLLGTDGQIGVIQVLDDRGQVLLASAGAPRTPLVSMVVPPTQSVSVGRVQLPGERGDYWVVARGANTPAGPVTVLVGGDREPVEAIVSTVGLLLAISGPLLVALVAWATYLLVGRALAPVERIRAQVAAISTEQLDERVPVPPTGDEIAHLARTMNAMLGRLESGHATQRRFISDASHELRSPLAAISAALDLAHHRPELLDAELIDESLIPETRRMRDLVEDLLLLARSDEQQLGGRAGHVDLDDIVSAEKARLQTNPELEVRSHISAVRVTGDTGQLARMVRNLVDNATRHAHRIVELHCERTGKLALIRIADDGPGIPADQRQRVFERFVRLDAARARDGGGSGLGLAIVAEIVAAHHGTVEISERSGGGTCATVTLPADTDSYVPADANR